MRVDQDSPKPTNGRHTPEHPFTGDGSVPNNTDGGEQAERTIPDELKLLLKQFRELGVYFSYFMTAKTDSVKLSLRHVVIWVVSAALGFVAVGGLIVIASWLMLSGLAEGLGGLFGNRSWVGSLLTGFLLLAGLGLGMYYIVAKRNQIARERTAQKYERLPSQCK
jgi:hypothetical protein